jgi:hypothetical protein
MAETTLDNLDDAAVAQAEDFLADFIKSEYPSLDLSEGRVLRDLLIRPAALFHVLNQTDIDRLRQSMSMKAVEADPTLADDEIVDGILSNYRITRAPGVKSTGLVTLIIANLLTTSVPQDTLFTSGSLVYVTAQSFVGVTSIEAVVTEQQRLIVARADGTFSFTVPVEAQTAGSGSVRRNTRFTVSPAPPGMIDAVAAQDFTEGTATQTNAELVALFKQALSPKTFAGRIHIEGLLREEVPAITDLSIIGFGDAEMLRDRHNLFELSTGGKADLYVRTQVLPESRTLAKDAVLIDAELKRWQFSIGRDDAPGFYVVQAVLPENSPTDQESLELIFETRGLDLSVRTNEFVPDVANIVEGAYSRYQTAVVQFTDPDFDVTGLIVNESTRKVDVHVMVLPNVDTLQDLSVDRATRNPSADYLVRAPVPAFLALNVKVQYRDGTPAPDTSALKTEIAARVNAARFNMGRISASIVHDAVHNVAGSQDVLGVSPLDFFCQIRKPSGETITLRSPNGIVMPDLPAEGVTSRTTAFFLGEESVDIELEKVPSRPV